MNDNQTNGAQANGATEAATLAGGCFWCLEAAYEQLRGVTQVVSGYTGGDLPNPSYEQVCTGQTGHAEVVQVTFDSETISYQQLLSYFWRLHDPTTLNRQGNDVGSQYRSVIFYHDEAQRQAAEQSKAAITAAGGFADPIVTEITTAGPFYRADDHHQSYYQEHREQPYCRFVILPKLDSLGLDT